MKKIMIRKDEYERLKGEWSSICYHMNEGFGCDLVEIREMKNYYKLYFETYKTQKEILAGLHWCLVDTNW
jgi:hypothetical protein